MLGQGIGDLDLGLTIGHLIKVKYKNNLLKIEESWERTNKINFKMPEGD